MVCQSYLLPRAEALICLPQCSIARDTLHHFSSSAHHRRLFAKKKLSSVSFRLIASCCISSVVDSGPAQSNRQTKALFGHNSRSPRGQRRHCTADGSDYISAGSGVQVASSSSSSEHGANDSNGYSGDPDLNSSPLENIGSINGKVEEDAQDEGAYLSESDSDSEEKQLKKHVSDFRRKVIEAEEDLEKVRTRSAELEEHAQKVAEESMALKDVANEAEAKAVATLSRVEEVLVESASAEENLKRVESACALAEEAAVEAEVALRDLMKYAENLVGPSQQGDGGELTSDQVLEESSAVENSNDVLDAAKARNEKAQTELTDKTQALAAARSEVLRLSGLKSEVQTEAMELSKTAEIAREKAVAAELQTAEAMELAEKAVGKEVEASKGVSVAKKALEEAEAFLDKVKAKQAEFRRAQADSVGKIAENLAQAAAILAEAEDGTDSEDELTVAVTLIEEAKDEVTRISNGKDILESGAQSPTVGVEELGALPVLKSTAAASPTDRLEVEKVASAVAKLEAEISAAVKEADEKALLEKKVDAAKEAEERVLAQKKAEAAKEAAAVPPVKAPTKKSSRFFPASYFSSEEGAELTLGEVFSGFMTSVKQHLPKVLAAAALLLAIAVLVNARMEYKATVQYPDVGQTVRPLLTEFKKIPGMLKGLVDKLPRGTNEEEASLFDVVYLLLSAIIFVPFFQKLPGGSPVLGYLTGGALIGPYCASIIQHVHATKFLAEFGVVFLMFNIGLETLITALVIGCISHFMTASSGAAAMIIGSGLALSSTAVVLQVLQERGESTSKHGRATFSVLLFQDLAVVVLLILIPLVSPKSSRGAGFGAIASALGVAAMKAVVSIGGIIAGGRLLLKPVYKRMAENHNAEIFAATTLLVVLGTSLFTARAGLSMALGAFLAGVMLSETEFALQVESDIAPYRGLLLGLFFMTVGMEINPRLFLAKFGVIIGAMAVLIIGKTLLVTGLGRIFGLSPVAGVRAGLLLAPGGEFAFVAFGEAVRQGILTSQLSSLLFLIVGLSMAITPYLAAGGQMIASKFEQHDVRSLQPAEAETDDLQGHVIIAGFGRVGQIIAQLLSERLIPFVALDVRTERVSAGRALDLPVYFGDAGSRDVLHKVGAERAAAAVITLDTPGANYRTVWALTKNFPNIKTFVRAHDVDHGLNLEKAGATAVVPETLEPSLQLAAAVLAQVKLPAAEIASTLDEFRTRHLSELTELSSMSGTSLGYGFPRPGAAKPKPPTKPDDGGVGELIPVAA
eukprot:jgi/Mesen1/6295/ME000325S05430